MLTAAQCRTVAYITDGSIVCPDCVSTADDCADNELCAYSAEEFAGDDGLYCEDCGHVIVEPTPRCEDCDKPEYDCICNEADTADTDNQIKE